MVLAEDAFSIEDWTKEQGRFRLIKDETAIPRVGPLSALSHRDGRRR